MSEVKFNVSISHESQLSQLKFCDCCNVECRCVIDSIGRGSSHNIEVGPWFSKSVPCTQHSWTKKSSIKVQEDARDDIDCIH